MIFKCHLYRVFASGRNRGNLAGVIFTDDDISESRKARLTRQLKVPDTAWIRIRQNRKIISYSTPKGLIRFCGHATLAAGQHYMMQNRKQSANFHFSDGTVGLFRSDKKVVMTARKEKLKRVQHSPKRHDDYSWYRSQDDYVMVVHSEDEVLNFYPKMKEISELNSRGLVVTASDYSGRYVLRFFAPQSGIREDPCTGSVQSVLAPYWQEKWGCRNFEVRQLSPEKGSMQVECLKKTVRICANVLFVKTVSFRK